MGYIGFLAIMLVIGVVINKVILALRDPVLIDNISVYAPWVGENAEVLTYVSCFILFVWFAYLPFKLKMHDDANGEYKMKMIGQSVLCGLFISSVVYVVGVLLVAEGVF